jgi:CBS domain containing-hemolysin-like protein
MAPHLPFVLAALGIVLLNAFFVAAEYAVVRIRATRMAELAAEGNWRARLVQGVLRRLDAFLPATQLGVTFTSLALGWLGEPAFEGLFRRMFEGLGVQSDAVVRNVSITAGFVLISFLHIVVGELVPRYYTIKQPERVALWLVVPMRVFQLVFWPALWVLSRVSEAILRTFGLAGDGAQEMAHSEEELRLLLAESHRLGALSGAKRELLENVIDYTERTARHVMVPRADVFFLSLARSLDENLAIVTQAEATRFPLATTDIDHVIGMVHVKDLFNKRAQLRSSDDLVAVKREILFVPETRPLDLLQRDFQQRRTHMAIIVDEYGGTSGLVTLEDVLEEIVGEIQDEFDREPPNVEETPEGLVFDGLTLIDDVAERLGVKVPEITEVSTLGGFVTAHAGRILRPGDKVSLEGYELRVVETRGRRVTKVLATPRPPVTADAARGG